jgi:hypothetical protein
MKNTENIKEELKGISPLFSTIEKPVGDAPNAVYFEQLQKNILSEINHKDTVAQKESSVTNLLQIVEGLFIPKYALSFAVIFSFLVLSINYFSFQNTQNSATLSSLSDNEIQLFLAENIDEFEEQMLLDENAPTTILDKNISAEQIEQYLENDFTTELL